MTQETDMYIDTDTFDFLSLDDVQEETIDRETFHSKSRVTQSAESIPRYQDNNLFNEEAEPTKPDDPNFNTDDLVGNSYEEQQAETQAFHELPDYAVIDLGHTQFTKQDVIQLVDAREQLLEQKAFYDAASKTDFTELDNFIADKIQLYKTEREKTIEAYLEAMENPLTDASTKGQYYDAVNKERAKLGILNQDVAKLQQARQEQEAAILNHRVTTTRNAMKQKYGSAWTPQEANSVFAYASQNGIPESTIAKNLDPALVEMFIKARNWDVEQAKRQSVSKQKIDQAWSRSKTSAHNTNKTENVSSSRAKQLQHKIRNGGLDAREVSDMFNHLVD